MIEENQTLEEFTPDEEMVIKDLETIKVLSHPLRLQILQMLIAGPRTVKEIAEEIGTPPNKLYYHFNLLEQHAAIRVVSTRIVSGIIEKSYRISAYRITPDPSLLSPASQEANETFTKILGTVFERTADDIRRSIDAGLIDLGNKDKQRRTLLAMNNLVRLSPEKARLFFTKLEEVMKEMDDSGGDNEEDRVYGLTIAFYPTTYRGPLAKDKEKGKRDEQSNA
nr:Helix-turn-helix domain protein [uncultured bacterium]